VATAEQLGLARVDVEYSTASRAFSPFPARPQWQLSPGDVVAFTGNMSPVYSERPEAMAAAWARSRAPSLAKMELM
jgi:hypothetical protein